MCWSDGVARVGDLTTVHHGDEGFGIGRRRLLDLLAQRARSRGVRVEFEHEVTADRLPEADLVVAGDEVNSALRACHADHFGSDITLGRNLYIWLGTTKVLDSLTFAFVETPQLYCRIDRAAGQSEALRRFKRWLGPRVARTVRARSRR